MPEVVDSEHFVHFDFDCVCVSGAGESLEVLEGVGPVAEGEKRESRAGEVHSGAEDEGSELRSVERATEWEEDEELECRDQVEANHLVLAESDHHLPCLLCRFGVSCLQIDALQRLLSLGSPLVRVNLCQGLSCPSICSGL